MLVMRTIDGLNFQWNVGRARPALSVPQLLSVLYVSAEGEEYKHIRENFHGTLPFKRNAVAAIWFGEHARFIVGNL